MAKAIEGLAAPVPLKKPQSDTTGPPPQKRIEGLAAPVPLKNKAPSTEEKRAPFQQPNYANPDAGSGRGQMKQPSELNYQTMLDRAGDRYGTSYLRPEERALMGLGEWDEIEGDKIDPLARVVGATRGIDPAKIEVEVDQKGNRFYRLPGEEKFSPANEPGMDFGDVRDLEGLGTEVLAGLTGEAVGGGLGAFAGSLAGPGGTVIGATSGVALGGALGEWGGRVINRKRLVESGAITEEEAAQMAADDLTDALITAGVGLSVPVVGKIFRAAKKRFDGMPDLSEEQIARAIENTKQKRNAVGIDGTVFTEQVLINGEREASRRAAQLRQRLEGGGLSRTEARNVRKELKAAEREANAFRATRLKAQEARESAETGAVLRGQQEEAQAAERRAVGEVSPEGDVPASADVEQFGRDVVAPRRAEEERAAAIGAEAEATGRQAISAGEQIAPTQEFLDNFRSGRNMAELRDTVDQAKAQSSKAFVDQRAAIERAANDADRKFRNQVFGSRVEGESMAGPIQAAERRANQIENLLGPLGQSRIDTLRRFVAGQTQENTTRPSRPKTRSLKQMNELLQFLREGRRDLAASGDNSAASELGSIVSELERARDTYLTRIGAPDLADQLRRVEGEYAQAMDTFEGSMVSNLIRRYGERKGGDYLIPPSKTLDSVLADEQGARRLVSTLREQGATDALSALQLDVRRHWAQNVLGSGWRKDFDLSDPKALKEIEERHQDYLKKNRDVLDAVLGQKGDTDIENVRNLARQSINMFKERDRILNSAAEEFGLIDWQKTEGAAGLFDKAYGSTEKWDQLTTYLSQRAENGDAAAESLMGDLRLLTRDRFSQRFIGDSRQGVDLKSLDSAKVVPLDENDLDLLMREATSETTGTSARFSPETRRAAKVLGRQYFEDLMAFRDVLKDTGVDYTERLKPENLQGMFVPSFRALAAPPLSRRGLVFTAARTAARENLDRRLAEIMTDPEKLRRLVAGYKTNDHSAILQTLFGTEATRNMLREVGADDEPTGEPGPPLPAEGSARAQELPRMPTLERKERREPAPPPQSRTPSPLVSASFQGAGDADPAMMAQQQQGVAQALDMMRGGRPMSPLERAAQGSALNQRARRAFAGP